MLFYQLPMAVQVPVATIAIGSISSLVKWIVDYARAWMPDNLEGKWIPPIAIGVGILLCFLAQMTPIESVIQGITYGFGAMGMASAQNSAEKAQALRISTKTQKTTDKDEDSSEDGKPAGHIEG